MTTKGTLVNEAYEELRISGLTVSPSTSDISMALTRLEDLMADWFSNWNMNINYNFQDTPATTQQSTILPNAKRAVVTNLAVELCAAFGKMVPPPLGGKADSAWRSLKGFLAANTIREIQPPQRMPAGSGNTFRGPWWYRRYQQPVSLPPNEAATNYIQQGETLDYYEDFSDWLGNATIASYSIEADPLLTVDTSANATPRITYTLTAPDTDSSQGPWQQVRITITDSTNRTLIKTINFEVTTPPEIGNA